MEKKISRGSEETFLIKTYKWPTAAKKKKKKRNSGKQAGLCSGKLGQNSGQGIDIRDTEKKTTELYFRQKSIKGSLGAA